LPEGWDRISRLERTCMECSKVLDPGDALFSALYLEENLFVRRDRCPECWEPRKGEAEFSYWRTVVPEPEDPAKKKRRIDAMLDPQILFDVFREMTDDPDPRKRRFRFVLSLMLVRRKKLRFVSIAKRKMDDGQQDCLVLKQKGRGARLTFDVVDVKLSEEEAVAAQQEVGQLLVMGGVGEAGEIDAALAAQDAAAPAPGGADAPEDDATSAEGGEAPSDESGAGKTDDAADPGGADETGDVEDANDTDESGDVDEADSADEVDETDGPSEPADDGGDTTPVDLAEEGPRA
jgi:hypothetical protein